MTHELQRRAAEAYLHSRNMYRRGFLATACTEQAFARETAAYTRSLYSSAG